MKINMKNLNVESLNNERLKGYGKLPKGIFQLTRERHLSISEAYYYAYLLLVAVDWDSRHKRTYSLIKYSQKEISEAYGVHSSTVSKYNSKLIAKDLLFESEYGVLGIKNFQKYQTLVNQKSVGIINLLNLPSNNEFGQKGGDESLNEDEINQLMDGIEEEEMPTTKPYSPDT